MGKHEKTRRKIDRKPVAADLTWREVESYLKNLGFIMIEGSGSRVKFYHQELNRFASFHKPHPEPEMDKAAVNYLSNFLSELDL